MTEKKRKILAFVMGLAAVLAAALWLARPFGHLPVRLRTTQANGDTLEHQLQSWPTAW